MAATLRRLLILLACSAASGCAFSQTDTGAEAVGAVAGKRPLVVKTESGTLVCTAEYARGVLNLLNTTKDSTVGWGDARNPNILLPYTDCKGGVHPERHQQDHRKHRGRFRQHPESKRAREQESKRAREQESKGSKLGARGQ